LVGANNANVGACVCVYERGTSQRSQIALDVISLSRSVVVVVSTALLLADLRRLLEAPAPHHSLAHYYSATSIRLHILPQDSRRQASPCRPNHRRTVTAASCDTCGETIRYELYPARRCRWRKIVTRTGNAVRRVHTLAERKLNNPMIRNIPYHDPNHRIW